MKYSEIKLSKRQAKKLARQIFGTAKGLERDKSVSKAKGSFIFYGDLLRAEIRPVSVKGAEKVSVDVYYLDDQKLGCHHSVYKIKNHEQNRNLVPVFNILPAKRAGGIKMTHSKVIAIMNEKGGCAKTTTATAMAYLLAKQGKKVALIDFDGQANTTLLMGKNPNKIDTTIATLIGRIISEQPLPKKEDYIIKTACGVDLIPANSQLFSLERSLLSIDFREYKLREYVETIRGDYDYIIIDCMPQAGTPMINAMMAADSLIIPTQAEILSAQGLHVLMQHFASIKKGHQKLKIDGILITMDNDRTIVSAKVREMLASVCGKVVKVFDTHIPRTIKVSEAAIYHKTICEYMPENTAAKAYENFVKEWLADEK